MAQAPEADSPAFAAVAEAGVATGEEQFDWGRAGSSAWFQELLRLLAEMREEAEAISHLEQAKTEAIASRDIAELAEITRREEELGTNLRALEQRRQGLVQAWAPTAEIDPTVEELASRLAEPRASALRSAGAELRSAVQRLKEETHRNGELLLWSADLARATAQWLAGFGQSSPVYTRTGTHVREDLRPVQDWRA
ncbi:MAG: flagellar protein FlgN [Chloroflexi bacterium]|nr:flagellar protein FlgN [Chloroflexota bacterium]